MTIQTAAIGLSMFFLNTTATFSQNCFNVKEGDKFKVHTKMYTLTPGSAEATKYTLMKEKDKKKFINAYNEECMSGKKAANSSSTVEMTVTKFDTTGGGIRITNTMVQGKKTYNFLTACKDDTIYASRNSEILWYVWQDDTLGFAIQGIKEYPLNMKVGDVLPKYYDYGIGVEKAVDVTLKKEVFSHIKTTSTIENRYGYNANTGESGFGNWKVTRTHAVYNTIDVNAKKYFSNSKHTIGYAVSKIEDKQPVTVHGKTYEAFIITSETWTQNIGKFKFESADKAVALQAETDAEKTQQFVRENQIKMGLANKEGYIVTKFKEWYVPGYGVVRTEQYDIFGKLELVMTVEY